MVAKGNGEGKASGDVDINDLIVVQGCCCSISSLYMDFPACLGGVVKGQCLCYEMDFKCCKSLDSASNDGRCCALMQGGYFCKSPETCVQNVNQCFCLDSRCALPCTDDVPMICTLLPFCSVYPKVACCGKLGDIAPANNSGATAPGAAMDESGPV